MEGAIKITRSENDKISKHFTENEFRCKSVDAPKFYWLDARLIVILEIIREFLGVPIFIVSPGRTRRHQLKLVQEGKTETVESFHLIQDDKPVKAVDWSFLYDNEYFMLSLKKEVETDSLLWRKLRAAGLKGIGFYDTFIHVDTATAPGLHTDSLGQYRTWDKRVNLKKEVSELQTNPRSFYLGILLILGLYALKN